MLFAICPTHVGVNRQHIVFADSYANLPHTRGGEPREALWILR